MSGSYVRFPFRWWWLLIGGLVVALVGGASGGWLVGLRSASTAGACDTAQVAKRVLPAVVTVFATGSDDNGSGSGSGAIIRSDGVILTNDHVIAPAATDGGLEVLLNDGERLRARLVGTDPVTDLAVLKVDAKKLPTLALAPERELAVGQPVVALGAPLGLSGTVTTGIVSALNRNVPAPTAAGGTTVLVGAIQTDAAINPGNSGGPLVTCADQLIGVNTAISTVPNASGVSGGGSVGIGFAVPASTASRISRELLANGRVSHPWLGADVAEISASLAERFGAKTGLFVQDVTSGGPAEQAGLRAGDIITRLGDHPATNAALGLLLASGEIGDRVKVTFVRGDETHVATATLAEQP